ncbi:MAG: hypothetical protein WBI18_01080 [Candidatus Saccharicenans sp.]
MKKLRVVVLTLFIIWFSSEAAGLMNEGKSRVDVDSYWKVARALWQRYSDNPTKENGRLFYDYILKSPAEGEKQDLMWFIKGSVFFDEVLAGNRLIILSALRLSLKAQKSIAKIILEDVGCLSRINPKLFLDILVEAYKFMGERVKDVVITLPEEYVYLSSRSHYFDWKYDGLLSYFYCHELKKRYQAVISVKGKRYDNIREMCLKELERAIDIHGCKQIEVSDEIFVDKVRIFVNLPEKVKKDIFDDVMETDMRKVIFLELYEDEIIFRIIENEAYSGNWKLMEELLIFETNVISFKENILWDLARIKPEVFLKFQKYQEEQIQDESKRINFLESYALLSLKSEKKIRELDYRINSLKKVKDREYRALRDRYIRIMKEIRDKEKQNLKPKDKPRLGSTGYIRD